jgi:hypothetical protein
VDPVIYVEQQPDGSWWACCDECAQRFGPYATEQQAGARADRHALAMGEVTPDER